MRIKLESFDGVESFQDNQDVLEVIDFLKKYNYTCEKSIELLKESIEEIEYKSIQLNLNEVVH